MKNNKNNTTNVKMYKIKWYHCVSRIQARRENKKSAFKSQIECSNEWFFELCKDHII